MRIFFAILLYSTIFYKQLRTKNKFDFRYIAVHNPLDYNQAMNDENAIRRRLLKYLLPVVIASIVFNIPKFLESRVSYMPYNVTEMVSIKWQTLFLLFMEIKISLSCKCCHYPSFEDQVFFTDIKEQCFCISCSLFKLLL